MFTQKDVNFETISNKSDPLLARGYAVRASIHYGGELLVATTYISDGGITLHPSLSEVVKEQLTNILIRQVLFPRKGATIIDGVTLVEVE